MHDSLIDNVYIQDENQSIVIMIDFAFWMQDEYKKSQRETGPIKVTFNKVKQYDIPKDIKWSEISILETKMDGKKIKFLLINDINDDYLEINIEAESIDVEVYD